MKKLKAEENNQKRKRAGYSGKLSAGHNNIPYFLNYIYFQILYSHIVLEQKGYLCKAPFDWLSWV